MDPLAHHLDQPNDQSTEPIARASDACTLARGGARMLPIESSWRALNRADRPNAHATHVNQPFFCLLSHFGTI
jgi:hypothetical protein